MACIETKYKRKKPNRLEKNLLGLKYYSSFFKQFLHLNLPLEA
jgi:hypothetical protein